MSGVSTEERVALVERLVEAKVKGEAPIANGVMPDFSDGVALFRTLAWQRRDVIIEALTDNDVSGLVEALERADALIENLWEAVPWGQTYNLDIAALNEVPMAIKRALAKHRQSNGGEA